MEFLSGEKELLKIDPAKVLMYNKMSFHYYWSKKVIITNKRVILSFTWFGVESFTPALSYFFDIKQYERFGKGRDVFVEQVVVGEGFWSKFIDFKTRGFFHPNLKIYTNDNVKIKHLIGGNV